MAIGKADVRQKENRSKQKDTLYIYEFDLKKGGKGLCFVVFKLTGTAVCLPVWGWLIGIQKSFPISSPKSGEIPQIFPKKSMSGFRSRSDINCHFWGGREKNADFWAYPAVVGYPRHLHHPSLGAAELWMACQPYPSDAMGKDGVLHILGEGGRKPVVTQNPWLCFTLTFCVAFKCENN